MAPSMAERAGVATCVAHIIFLMIDASIAGLHFGDCTNTTAPGAIPLPLFFFYAALLHTLTAAAWASSRSLKLYQLSTSCLYITLSTAWMAYGIYLFLNATPCFEENNALGTAFYVAYTLDYVVLMTLETITVAIACNENRAHARTRDVGMDGDRGLARYRDLESGSPSPGGSDIALAGR